MGFEQSQTDECVFYKGSTIFMVYTDDGIFAGPDKGDIEKCVAKLGRRFNITDEGAMDEYLRVKVTREPDGSIKLA